MKTVRLLHNPKAGDKAHSKKKLVRAIEAQGFKCRYSSVKDKNWGDTEFEEDFLAIAGGDGTVRRVIAQLLERRLIDRSIPLAVLPLGTANNIGKTLGLPIETEETINLWRNATLRKFDVGRITGLPDLHFFLEGIGFGVFPNLMNKMKKHYNSLDEPPEQQLKTALKVLYDIIRSYKARECTLEMDGSDHSGKFLLVEIMNTRSVGPNLDLNPGFDTGDGEFEVITVPESQREKLLAYIDARINGKEEPFFFNALKAKKVRMRWHGIHIHADDEVLKLRSPVEVMVEVREKIFDFLVPGHA